MDILEKLQKSRVSAVLPDSDLCQPVKYSSGPMPDPFADMPNLEAVLNTYRSPRTSFEPTHQKIATIADVIQGILFALDGTYQLLNGADAQKKVDAFVKVLIDDLSTKQSLKASKIRWISSRVDRVNQELSAFRKTPMSTDFVELLSAHLGAGVTVLDTLQKTCIESGWQRCGNGVVMRWDIATGMSVVDDDTQPLASGLRVMTAAQKAEVLRAF